jgi:thimet oligopeptidase
MKTLQVSAILATAGFVAAGFAAQSAQAQSVASQAPVWASKPDIAAWEKTQNDRLDTAQKFIAQMTAVTGPRTIDNTLEPFDEAVRNIDSAAYIAQDMEQVHPDAAFRDHATTMVTKASAVQTALSLNQEVYKALASLDLSKADPATQYYVKRTLLEFRLAGVDKDQATRDKLKTLNDQLTQEQSTFERNIDDDVKSVKADPSELAGLPQDYIDAHKPGADGKVTITTAYPDVFPVLDYAKSDDLRHRIFLTFDSRAYPKNQDVLEQMLKTRYEIATLLGYHSWADFNAADKMALSGKNVEDFITQLAAAAKPAMEREYTMLLAEKKKTVPNATEVKDYERRYYDEQLSRSSYAFDSQSVRPYFPYNEVKQGVLNTASTLFHVTFQQEQNVPGWDPSVETWDVLDGGTVIGRFYLDMHPRPGKYTHAEMAPVLDGIRGKQLPEAMLVCNLPETTATDPGLMDYEDAVTFFHEFGHLMHHILGGQQQWAGISGITMEGDFVEAPSQMLEEWMHSPQVLATFAKNYKTGEPIPAELVAKMNRADAFGRGMYVSQQLAYSAISFDVYKSNPEDVDAHTIVMSDLQKYTPLKISPESGDFYTSFDHLTGYSSAYYTYMWDLVIAEDFFRQFDQQNLLAGPTPMRYRHMVLEPGGSMSANDLVKNFLGRPQSTDAIKAWMNVEFAPTPGGGGASKAGAPATH